MFWASLVFVVNERDGILTLRRSSQRGAHRGKWGLPGGKADRGEMPEETAARELYEETGIRVEEEELEFLTKDSSGNRDYYFFLARVGDPEVIIDLEHDAVAWVLPEAIRDWIGVPTSSAVYDSLDKALD